MKPIKFRGLRLSRGSKEPWAWVKPFLLPPLGCTYKHEIAATPRTGRKFVIGQRVDIIAAAFVPTIPAARARPQLGYRRRLQLHKY